MEGPTLKKTNEPPKRANQKGNIKFLNPPLVARNISHNERGRPPERRPSLHKPSPTATTHLKIETVSAHYNITDTICLQKGRAKLKEEGLLFKSFCKSNMGDIEIFMKRMCFLGVFVCVFFFQKCLFLLIIWVFQLYLLTKVVCLLC
jgi:hypothetical protein